MINRQFPLLSPVFAPVVTSGGEHVSPSQVLVSKRYNPFAPHRVKKKDWNYSQGDRWIGSARLRDASMNGSEVAGCGLSPMSAANCFPVLRFLKSGESTLMHLCKNQQPAVLRKQVEDLFQE